MKDNNFVKISIKDQQAKNTNKQKTKINWDSMHNTAKHVSDKFLMIVESSRINEVGRYTKLQRNKTKDISI